MECNAPLLLMLIICALRSANTRYGVSYMVLTKRSPVLILDREIGDRDGSIGLGHSESSSAKVQIAIALNVK